MSTSKPRKRKPSKRQLEKLERERQSRAYSVGYRFCLYDPLKPDAPVRNCGDGESGKTFRTFTAAEMKTFRDRVTFANRVLISAGAKYLVAMVPAALTGFASVADSDWRITRSDTTTDEFCYRDDDDDEGEEWKQGKPHECDCDSPQEPLIRLNLDQMRLLFNTMKELTAGVSELLKQRATETEA